MLETVGIVWLFRLTEGISPGLKEKVICDDLSLLILTFHLVYQEDILNLMA